MVSSASPPTNLSKIIDEKINRSLARFNNTTKSLVGNFNRLTNSVSGLTFKLAVLTGAATAPVLAFQKLIQSADQSYNKLLSGAAGLVAGSTNSFTFGMRKMAEYQSIVENSSAEIGANFDNAFSMVAGTIDDVKNAIGRGGIITPAQEDLLREYANKATLFSKVAEGSGTDPARISGALSQFMNGTMSLKQLGILDAFSETKMTQYLKQSLQARGVDERSASAEQRAMAFMEAVEKAFPSEMVEELRSRPTAIFARWRLFFFGQEKGVLSLNRTLKKNFGIFQGRALDSGADAVYYFLTKFQEFATRLARALGIKGDPMEAIAQGLVSLGNSLAQIGIEIETTAADIRSRGLWTVVSEKVTSKFEDLRNWIGTSISAFIDEQIKPASPSVFKEAMDIAGDIGPTVALFINNFLEEIPKLLDNVDVNLSSYGFGALVGRLINSIAKGIESVDFGAIWRAGLSVFEEVVKPALMGAASQINWRTVLEATLKVVATASLSAVALGFVGALVSAVVAATAGLPVILTGAVALAGYQIVKNWESIGDTLNTLMGNTVGEVISPLLSVLNNLSPWVMPFVESVVRLFQNLMQLFAGLWAVVQPILTLGFNTFVTALEMAWGLFRMIASFIGLIWALISPILNTLLKFSLLVAQGLVQTIAFMYNALVVVITPILKALAFLITEGIKGLSPIFNTCLNTARVFIETMLSTINGTSAEVYKLWGQFDLAWNNFITGIVGKINELWEAAKSKLNPMNWFGGGVAPRTTPQPALSYPIGSRAFGNYPSWLPSLSSALQTEMQNAPVGAKPVIANDSELIIPRSQVKGESQVTKGNQVHITANFAPVVNGEVNEARLFQLFKTFFNEEVTSRLAAEY